MGDLPGSPGVAPFFYLLERVIGYICTTVHIFSIVIIIIIIIIIITIIIIIIIITIIIIIIFSNVDSFGDVISVETRPFLPVAAF